MKTDTLLLIGAAAVGVYLLTRPKLPTTYNPYGQPAYNPYGTGIQAYNPYLQQQQGSTLAQDITAGGSALEGLGDLIGNFF